MLTHQHLWVPLGLSCKPSYMINDRGKVGRSPQLHRPEGSVIGLDDALDTSTVGVGGIPIERKLVRHLTSNFTTESQSRK